MEMIEPLGCQSVDFHGASVIILVYLWQIWLIFVPRYYMLYSIINIILLLHYII